MCTFEHIPKSPKKQIQIKTFRHLPTILCNTHNIGFNCNRTFNINGSFAIDLPTHRHFFKNILLYIEGT